MSTNAVVMWIMLMLAARRHGTWFVGRNVMLTMGRKIKPEKTVEPIGKSIRDQVGILIQFELLMCETHRSIVRLRPLQLLLGRLCAYEEAVPVRILLATKRHWGSSQHFTELFFVHRNGVYQLRKEIELILGHECLVDEGTFDRFDDPGQ